MIKTQKQQERHREERRKLFEEVHTSQVTNISTVELEKQLRVAINLHFLTNNCNNFQILNRTLKLNMHLLAILIQRKVNSMKK